MRPSPFIRQFSVSISKDAIQTNTRFSARDGATIHLTKATDEEVLRCVRGHTETYIEVSEIQTRTSGQSLELVGCKIDTRFAWLVERPYGMTELHIADPDDCLDASLGNLAQRMKPGRLQVGQMAIAEEAL